MATPLTRRDPGFIALINLVTLGLYTFYWIPKLGQDVNRVIAREKYRFGVVLFLGIITIGVALCIFEILYAYDLAKNERYRQLTGAKRTLGGAVLVINVIAFVLALATAGMALVLSIIAGIWATWLVQDAINQIAESEQAIILQAPDSSSV